MGRILGIAVVMAILAAAAPGRFGGHHAQTQDGPLRWQAPARTSAIAGAANDHLLFGRVVNHSGRPIRLRASDVHVVDRDGHRLPTRAAFADGFVPSVMLSGYSGEMYEADTGSQVGREILLRTGAAAPVSASFTADGDERAAAIEYAGGRLTLK